MTIRVVAVKDRSGVQRHEREAGANLRRWHDKPVLQKIYREFHQLIARQLADVPGDVVEIGSGIGNIREVIPQCIRTDLYASAGVDQVENAYQLSFADASVSNLILFDVFHHLRYPGEALHEFARVLAPGGRVIVFEPCVSLLGLVVYGPLHPEPLALRRPITWSAPANWNAADAGYYAAQGNASRIFLGHAYANELKSWRRIRCTRLAALSYVASGGYSGPQLYPDALYPLVRALDRILNPLPWIFATRLLAVMQKPDASSGQRD